MTTVAPLPLFLRLAGKRVLLVGGGPVARDKAQGLKDAGAEIVVVAPEVHADLVPLASEVHRRPFVASDVDNSWLVVAAGPTDVNRGAREAADARRIFILAVDDVASCSAFGAARLERGGVTVAISSDGRAPALVALLRQALEALLPEDLATWLDLAARARPVWKRDGVPLAARRPLLLEKLNALYDRHPEHAQ